MGDPWTRSLQTSTRSLYESTASSMHSISAMIRCLRRKRALCRKLIEEILQGWHRLAWQIALDHFCATKVSTSRFASNLPPPLLIFRTMYLTMGRNIYCRAEQISERGIHSD